MILFKTLDSSFVAFITVLRRPAADLLLVFDMDVDLIGVNSFVAFTGDPTTSGALFLFVLRKENLDMDLNF